MDETKGGEDECAESLAKLRVKDGETEGDTPPEIHAPSHPEPDPDTHPDTHPTLDRPIAKRVAVLGNVDSGKSTLIGCLTRKIQDNGRGYARQFSFSHPHEVELGRTSDIGVHPVGFDEHGELVGVRAPGGRQVHMKRRDLWTAVGSHAHSMALLIDLCGHERYFRSTCRGVVSQMPHYAMVLVAANKNPAFLLDPEEGPGTKGGRAKGGGGGGGGGWGGGRTTNMTRQHLGIVHGMHIPFFVVVTKVDLPAREVFRDTMTGLGTLLRRNFKCEPKLVRSEALVEEAVADILGKRCVEAEVTRRGTTKVVKRRIVPVFAVSTVTGDGMPWLTRFLHRLPARHNRDTPAIKIREADLRSEEDEGPGAGGSADKPSTSSLSAGVSVGVSAGVGGSVDTANNSGESTQDTTTQDTSTQDTTTQDAEKAIVLHSWVFGSPSGDADEKPLEFADGEVGVDDILWKVTGTAVVVTGLVVDGKVGVDQEMLLGPDAAGEFVPVTVRSIEVQYRKREWAQKGEMAGFGLRLARKHREFPIRKGMYLTAPEKAPRPTRFFMAAMTVLHHSTTIRRGCVLSVNTGPVHRAARVVKMMALQKRADGTLDMDAPDIAAVATGDRALIILKFLVQGVILHLGDQIAVREGAARGVGYVVRCFKSSKEYQRYRDKGSSIWAAEEAYLADVEDVSRRQRAKQFRK